MKILTMPDFAFLNQFKDTSKYMYQLKKQVCTLKK